MYVEVEAARALARTTLSAEYDEPGLLVQALAAKIFCSQARLRWPEMPWNCSVPEGLLRTPL